MSNAPSEPNNHAPPILIHLLKAFRFFIFLLALLVLLTLSFSAMPTSVFLYSEHLPPWLSDALYLITGISKSLISFSPPLETFSQTIGGLSQKLDHSLIDAYESVSASADVKTRDQFVFGFILILHILAPLLVWGLAFVKVLWGLVARIAGSIADWVDKTFINPPPPPPDQIEMVIQTRDRDFNTEPLPLKLESGLTRQCRKEAEALHKELKKRSDSRNHACCYLRIQYLNADDQPVSEEIRNLNDEGEVAIDPQTADLSPIRIVRDWDNGGAYISASSGVRIPLEYGTPKIIRKNNRGGVSVQHYALTLFGNGG